MNKNLVLSAIVSGDLDADLSDIIDAIKTRKQKLGFERIREIDVGDIVTFTDRIRPGYLGGGTAEVTGKMQKNVVIKILTIPQPLPMNARFKEGQTIRCPANLLILPDVGAAVEAIKDKYSGQG